MIEPSGFRGAAFGTARDGDGRSDRAARRRISRDLGIPEQWAYIRQVHGAEVIRAASPGLQGEADALFTTVPMLPLVVATADCVPVILEGDGGVGVAHAGWRGAAGGVVPALRRAMERAGAAPSRAAVGPAIGPCCYEVGAEVTSALGSHRSSTSWGSPSVDLASSVADDLEGLEVWSSESCTRCGDGYHSYRRDGTKERQVAVAWLTSG